MSSASRVAAIRRSYFESRSGIAAVPRLYPVQVGGMST